MKWEKERFAVIRGVRETLRRWTMFQPGETVLLAVSGGADSLVLMDVMVQIAGEEQVYLEVVHIDHGLRPESGDEADFVRNAAGHYGLACAVKKVNVGNYVREEGMSPEEAARAARYDAFREELRESGAGRLATGHTADDRVETLLLRMIAGAGPRGLGSIPPVRLPYVRPLIRAWRSEVEAYARHLPFTPRRDPTNMDVSIPRNRVRHRLIPLLEKEYNPSVRRALSREADIMSSVDELLEGLAERAEEESVEVNPRGVEMEVSGLLLHPVAVRRQVIIGAIRKLGLKPDFSLVEDIRRGLLEADGNAGLDLGPGMSARRVYGRLIIGPKPALRRCEDIKIPGEGFYELPHVGAVLEVSLRPSSEEDTKKEAGHPDLAWLDADRLEFPLKLRGIKPGDRFHPLGAPGSRKMQDFLVDAKMPREERPGVAVLESGGEIAWVVGMRVDDRFKVRDETRHVAVLRLLKGSGESTDQART
ncbi:MAG: tRNA lysidine(34) synthetase TilS [Actinomycetota bacterium]|nr:tRNA lysidine(34) synthetase TilS [Actinomycetota bacterium]